MRAEPHRSVERDLERAPVDFIADDGLRDDHPAGYAAPVPVAALGGVACLLLGALALLWRRR